MRILVLGIPRSGTTSIYNSIKNDNSNLTCYFEPWGVLNYHDNLDMSPKNLLIKSQIFQKPNYKEDFFKSGLSDYRLIETLEFYKKIIPKFDNVILISRKDSIEGSISYQEALISKNWFSEYSTKIKFPDEGILNIYNHFLKNIELLSKQLNLKVWYYEDLFIESNEKLILSFAKEVGLEIKNEELFLKNYNIKNRLRNLDNSK